MGVDTDKLPDGNLPQTSRAINGTTYHVTRLGWWEVQDLIALLSDVLGPSLSGLVEGVEVKGEEPEVPWRVLLAELPAALRRASVRDGAGRDLQRRLMETTRVEFETEGRRSRVWLDATKGGLWFSQHPKDFIPWLLFALEVQVMDFFEPLTARLGTGLGSVPLGRGLGALAEEPRSQNT